MHFSFSILLRKQSSNTLSHQTYRSVVQVNRITQSSEKACPALTLLVCPVRASVERWSYRTKSVKKVPVKKEPERGLQTAV